MISVSTSQLVEDNINIRNPFQSRSEKKIIQNNTQYIANLLQTSTKSTVPPVGFIETAKTSQSQTLARMSSKVKIRNVPNSILDCTNSKFPLTIGGTVFYQPQSEYQFPDPRDNGFNYYNVDDNNHVDRKKLLYPPINEEKPLIIEDLAEIVTMNRKDPLPEWTLSQNHSHWHEWFGQFVSAVDSARLFDDVKLAYLETLVTGKAKNTIAEIAYSGVLYKVDLNTLIRNFDI